jgi:hypothetical protein
MEQGTELALLFAAVACCDCVSALLAWLSRSIYMWPIPLRVWCSFVGRAPFLSFALVCLVWFACFLSFMVAGSLPSTSLPLLLTLILCLVPPSSPSILLMFCAENEREYWAGVGHQMSNMQASEASMGGLEVKLLYM